jgi:hypothetical protein
MATTTITWKKFSTTPARFRIAGSPLGCYLEALQLATTNVFPFWFSARLLIHKWILHMLAFSILLLVVNQSREIVDGGMQIVEGFASEFIHHCDHRMWPSEETVAISFIQRCSQQSLFAVADCRQHAKDEQCHCLRSFDPRTPILVESDQNSEELRNRFDQTAPEILSGSDCTHLKPIRIVVSTQSQEMKNSVSWYDLTSAIALRDCCLSSELLPHGQNRTK